MTSAHVSGRADVRRTTLSHRPSFFAADTPPRVDSGRGKTPPSSSTSPPPFFSSSASKTPTPPLFGAATSKREPPPLSFFDTPASRKNSVTRRPTIDSLHNGIATHPSPPPPAPLPPAGDNKTRRGRRNTRDPADDLQGEGGGGYNPSMTLGGDGDGAKPRSGAGRRNKKNGGNDLLADLFPAATGNSSPTEEGGGIFGDIGGATTQPRRSRHRGQASTLVNSARPSINAIGSFDDDLEEVKL